MYTRAQEDIDKQAKKQRRKIRNALASFHILGKLVLGDEVNDAQLRQAVFGEIDRETLADQVESVEIWLTGKVQSCLQSGHAAILLPASVFAYVD